MKLADYKTETLARTDVDDIVKIETVENRPVQQPDGTKRYEPVVHTTENGRKLIKLDVHLMRQINGVKDFTTEQIAVLDQGEATEEVVRRAKSTAPTTESQIEKFIHTQPGYHKQIQQIDVDAPSAVFTALVPEAGTVRKVTYLAYRDGATNKVEEITNP